MQDLPATMDAGCSQTSRTVVSLANYKVAAVGHCPRDTVPAVEIGCLTRAVVCNEDSGVGCMGRRAGQALVGPPREVRVS